MRYVAVFLALLAVSVTQAEASFLAEYESEGFYSNSHEFHAVMGLLGNE